LQLPKSNRTPDTIRRRCQRVADNLCGHYCSEQYIKQAKLSSTFHPNYAHHWALIDVRSGSGVMHNLQLKLSEDRSMLTLELQQSNEDTSGMTADAVQQLIAVLAGARAVMTPPIPQTDPPAGEPSLSRDPMRWWAGPDYGPTRLCLALLHPGLGWVSMALHRAEAQELISGLQRILESRPTLQ
jgi:hypothetical protein